MKKMIVILVLMFAGIFTTESKAGYGDVNFHFFYHNLRPHGEWIQIDYDLVVWKPYRVDRYWSPYSVGHWEYTGYGWYWESYEPFGWATYHYGRWYNDDFYGWVWVPGYEWGPSWVEWRYSDNYIGWAPLPPYASFRINVGIHFSISYRSSYHYWNFVPFNRFHHRNVYVHFIPVGNKNRVFNNTKYRTNYYSDRGRIINGGVDRNYIERRSGSRIVEREIARTTDLREFTGSRGNVNSNRIVTYQPDEREVQKFREMPTTDINKGSSKSTLRRDVVTFRNEENKSREVLSNNREEVRRDAEVRDVQSRSPQTSRPEVRATERSQRELQETRKAPQRETNNREVKRNDEQPKRTQSIFKSTQPTKRENSETRSTNNNRNNSPSVSTNRSERKETVRSTPVKRQETKSNTQQRTTTKKRND